MTPENHDAAFAAVSHLPHMLAFAYFNSVSRQPAGSDFLSLGGPGFRDFTRIAASNPEVWRDILMANREEILKQTQRFRHTLDAMEHVVKTGNTEALEALIRSASDARAGWQMNAADAEHAPLARGPRADVRDPLSRHPAAATASPAPCACRAPRASRTAPCCSPASPPARRPSHGLLDSDDTRVMLDALARARLPLRARRRAPASCTASAASRCRTTATLFLGNAGTAMRPLTAALAVAAARPIRASSCAARRACTSGRSATWSMPCASSAARSTTSATRASRRCASRRPGRRAAPRRADPRARRCLEPVPHRAAARAAAGGRDAPTPSSRSTAS